MLVSRVSDLEPQIEFGGFREKINLYLFERFRLFFLEVDHFPVSNLKSKTNFGIVG